MTALHLGAKNGHVAILEAFDKTLWRKCSKKVRKICIKVSRLMYLKKIRLAPSAISLSLKIISRKKLIIRLQIIKCCKFDGTCLKVFLKLAFKKSNFWIGTKTWSSPRFKKIIQIFDFTLLYTKQFRFFHCTVGKIQKFA